MKSPAAVIEAAGAKQAAALVKGPDRPPPVIARMSDAFTAADAMLRAGAPKNPLRTGFAELDAGLRRLGPKEVTMLAAADGIGKSTIATQAALHAAMCGHGAVYLNLEMSEEMYGMRTGANFVRLPTNQAAAGELDDEEMVRLRIGFETLRAAARHIALGNQREHRTIPTIKTFCQDAAKILDTEGYPLALVIVDHILQVEVPSRNDKDVEGKMRADMLKEIADTMKVHVLALVHITKEGSKTGKMPTKNDIASSAWFTRHPDNVLIFHQKRSEDGTFAKANAMLSCQKARWGKPFAVELEYQQGFFYPWQLEPRRR